MFKMKKGENLKSVCARYLVVGRQRVAGQQRPVVDGVRSGVDQDGSVLYLQDLDAVSHHRRHTELTQLQKKKNKSVNCQLLMIIKLRDLEIIFMWQDAELIKLMQ